MNQRSCPMSGFTNNFKDRESRSRSGMWKLTPALWSNFIRPHGWPLLDQSWRYATGGKCLRTILKYMIFLFWHYYGKYLSKFLMTGLSLLCDGILIFLSVLSFGIKNYFWIYCIFVWAHDSFSFCLLKCLYIFYWLNNILLSHFLILVI